MLSECGGGGLSNNDNGFDDFTGIDRKSSRKWITQWKVKMNFISRESDIKYQQRLLVKVFNISSVKIWNYIRLAYIFFLESWKVESI